MTDEQKELVGRLLKIEGAPRPHDPLAVGTNWYRNPDGPEAATTIEALADENARLREALERCARASDGWDVDMANLHAWRVLKETDRAMIAAAKGEG